MCQFGSILALKSIFLTVLGILHLTDPESIIFDGWTLVGTDSVIKSVIIVRSYNPDKIAHAFHSPFEVIRFLSCVDSTR